MPDHVHMLVSIPPKYAVSQVVGYIKGKSAIHLARVYGERKRNFVGQHFWARGYFVSTVGRVEQGRDGVIAHTVQSACPKRRREAGQHHPCHTGGLDQLYLADIKTSKPDRDWDNAISSCGPIVPLCPPANGRTALSPSGARG
jgi:putative transposase